MKITPRRADLAKRNKGNSPECSRLIINYWHHTKWEQENRLKKEIAKLGVREDGVKEEKFPLIKEGDKNLSNCSATSKNRVGNFLYADFRLTSAFVPLGWLRPLRFLNFHKGRKSRSRRKNIFGPSWIYDRTFCVFNHWTNRVNYSISPQKWPFLPILTKQTTNLETKLPVYPQPKDLPKKQLFCHIIKWSARKRLSTTN